jgi:hypothetical protein
MKQQARFIASLRQSGPNKVDFFDGPDKFVSLLRDIQEREL